MNRNLGMSDSTKQVQLAALVVRFSIERVRGGLLGREGGVEREGARERGG